MKLIRKVNLGMLIFLLAFGVLSGQSIRKTVVCRDELDEPTLLETIKAALPNDLKHAIDNATFQFIGAEVIPLDVLQLKVPIATAFSEGEYQVMFDTSFTFKDVNVYEESFSNANLPCSISYHYLPFGRSICGCSTQLDKAEASVLSQSSTPFCRLPAPCDANDFRNKVCKIRVDPFRRTCVVISSQEAISQSVVQYKKVMPSVASLVTSLDHEYIKDSLDSNTPLSWLLLVCQYVPLHLVSLLMGLYITIHAKDLAESHMVQTIIQATLGLVIATVFLLFILYRPVERILSRYGGLAGTVFPFSITATIFSAIYRNPWVIKQILWLFYEFWRDGAFGFEWLGKIYFMGSIALVCSISWYFDWFDIDGRFFFVMHYAVRCVGLVAMYCSTPSRDVAFVFVILGLFLEYLYPYLYFLSLMYTAKLQSRPSGKSSLRKMSAEEAAAISKKATKEALDKLREHLQSNEKEMYWVTDRLREGDKKDTAQLLARFAQGNYSGVPHSGEEEEEKRGSKYWVLLVRGLGVLAVVGILYIFCW